MVRAQAVATHRNQRRPAKLRDHLADMAIGFTAGTFLALTLWFATEVFWLR